MSEILKEKLREAIGRTDGRVLVFTGTFDPAHRGHVEALNRGFLHNRDAKSAFVVAHNWNTEKSPKVDLRKRRDWVKDSVDEQLPIFSNRIFVGSADEVVSGVEDFDAIMSYFAERIVRVFGSGSFNDLLKYTGRQGVSVFSAERGPISSSLIRQAVGGGSIEGIRHLLVAKVAGEIEEGNHYR